MESITEILFYVSDFEIIHIIKSFFFYFIEAALNLFINSNSQELLKEMKPHLKKKLLILIRNFAQKLFDHVPYDAFLV